jgi:GNAT superfamily N-acetyltransferase
MSLRIEMRNHVQTRRQIRSFMKEHDEGANAHWGDRLDLVYKKSGHVVAGAKARILCGNCFVSTLFVMPDERRQGLGSSLLNEIRAFQMQSKASLTTLSTRDVETKRFLDERGMVVDGRIRHCPTSHTLAFYSGTPRFKKVDVMPANTLKKNAEITGDEWQELDERIETEAIAHARVFSVTLALIEDEGKMRGGLIGSVLDNCLEIEALIVSPSVRKQGYGKRLLETIETYGKEQGIERLFVRPFCFHDRAFLSHMGYRGFDTPCHAVLSKSLKS